MQRYYKYQYRFNASHSFDYKKEHAHPHTFTMTIYISRQDQDEQILFYIDEFADSGINMYVKFYATIEKFFDAKWDAMWKLKKAFDENGIEIPFNQVDVHMRQ